MSTPTPTYCPACKKENIYFDGSLYACPDCGHEWDPSTSSGNDSSKKTVDANGNELVDGDSVLLIKDLKVKGSSLIIKKGTKVKNIRIVEGDHDIDCKVDGVGGMKLKSEFLKKA